MSTWPEKFRVLRDGFEILVEITHYFLKILQNSVKFSVPSLKMNETFYECSVELEVMP